MAGCDSELFRVDSLTVDGDVLPIEDGSATLQGVADFETEAVLAGTGDDATTRKRVARVIKAKILFGVSVTPDQYTKVCNAQMVCTNLHTGQRVRAGKCRFKSMGEVGNGAVDIEFNVLQPYQWL
ncbi:hypothetical protein DXT88_22100 [Herbaspirillum lusitanum]|uniref:hypothetical protein n=1 Tax=Herbaspirillum lusitanum TaxID=213312 RepID=UPI0022374CC8|nr:hypothetical protein [Herbaspirillum lusitanum]MCW5300868.1 hypothetical protein [Herbaspirillum lusitanum]